MDVGPQTLQEALDYLGQFEGQQPLRYPNPTATARDYAEPVQGPVRLPWVPPADRNTIPGDVLAWRLRRGVVDLDGKRSSCDEMAVAKLLMVAHDWQRLIATGDDSLVCPVPTDGHVQLNPELRVSALEIVLECPVSCRLCVERAITALHRALEGTPKDPPRKDPPVTYNTSRAARLAKIPVATLRDKRQALFGDQANLTEAQWFEVFKRMRNRGDLEGRWIANLAKEA